MHKLLSIPKIYIFIIYSTFSSHDFSLKSLNFHLQIPSLTFCRIVCTNKPAFKFFFIIPKKYVFYNLFNEIYVKPNSSSFIHYKIPIVSPLHHFIYGSLYLVCSTWNDCSMFSIPIFYLMRLNELRLTLTKIEPYISIINIHLTQRSFSSICRITILFCLFSKINAFLIHYFLPYTIHYTDKYTYICI